MIAVCVKWVDTRPELDASGATVAGDQRFGGISPADQAALEWALRCRERWGDDVLVTCVGPPAAEPLLRELLAVGATEVIRIHAPGASTSEQVAQLLASQLRSARLVWCGDYSFDRGTGSVPAFLAGELNAAQALGLVQVELTDQPETMTVLRRLDGGRRERLRIPLPGVLSVEGSTATLRRAPLRSLLKGGSVTTVAVPVAADGRGDVALTTRAFRPRARVMPAPVGATALQRLRAMTDTGAVATSGETVVLDPAPAAERIIDTLRAWGYLS